VKGKKQKELAEFIQRNSDKLLETFYDVIKEKKKPLRGMKEAGDEAKKRHAWSKQHIDSPKPIAWRVPICGEWQYFTKKEDAIREREFQDQFDGEAGDPPEPLYAALRPVPPLTKEVEEFHQAIGNSGAFTIDKLADGYPVATPTQELLVDLLFQSYVPPEVLGNYFPRVLQALDRAFVAGVHAAGGKMIGEE
jgi:hypothetical protein